MAKEERVHRRELCLFNKLHINTGMKLLVAVGIVTILGLVGLLYVKFLKAMFVLLIPTTVVAITVAGIVMRRHNLIWPIFAISMFHVILSAYALLIFSFYFFFKPLYIIMVLNWAFGTLHPGKTASYYFHCSCVYAALISFLTFNVWQGMVSFAYRTFLYNSSRRQPTVLVVNKPGFY